MEHAKHPRVALAEERLGGRQWRQRSAWPRIDRAAHDVASNPDRRRSPFHKPADILLNEVELDEVRAVERRGVDAEQQIDARSGREIVRQRKTKLKVSSPKSDRSGEALR
jgi:hypothetical protein